MTRDGLRRWLRGLRELPARQGDLQDRVIGVQGELAATQDAQRATAARDEAAAAALGDLRRELGEVTARLDEALGRLGRLEAAAAPQAPVPEAVGRLEEVLRVVAADEPRVRDALWALRADPAAARAWDDDEPLVTVSIVTRDRAALLGERALPSVLAQTYERLQVLVVGDDATPEVEAVARWTGDPRVRFVNLRTRVVKPTAHQQWLTATTLPRNEAYRLAEGAWTLDFDDDDALAPGAVATLLAAARRERAEVAYGRVRQLAPDGTVELLGDWPPASHRFSLAAALVHAGLRVVAREHVASPLGVPGDWWRTERLLRAGARFAHVEEPVLDYFPSTLWGGGPP